MAREESETPEDASYRRFTIMVFVAMLFVLLAVTTMFLWVEYAPGVLEAIL